MDTVPRRFAIPHPGWLLGIGLCLVAGALNLIVWVPYYRVRSVVTHIERLGGRVDLEAGGSNRLRQILGDDVMSLFDDVVTIDLSNTTATDADLRRLTVLTKLRMLDLLGRTGTTDAGVRELQHALPRLVVRRNGQAVLGVGGGPAGGGFLIGLVQPGSAAERAKLKPGDILTHLDGHSLADFPTLVRLISAKRAGDKVELQLLRGGAPLKCEAVLGQWK
jgi:predicted metalloprotease with PDZ domain